SCSAASSTRAMVATTCCASTTRQAWPRQARASEASAVGVQVIEDMHQALGAEDELAGAAVQAQILPGQPGAGGIAGTDDGMQRAEQPHQQQRQLAGLAVRLQPVIAPVQPG